VWSRKRGYFAAFSISSMAFHPQSKRARRFLAAFALGMLTAVSVSAGSVSTVLVDNLEGPVSSVRIDYDEQVAQSFVTGSESYLLNKVVVHLGAAGFNAHAEVLIHVDSAGLPGTVLATLNQTAVESDQLQDYEFPAPGDISLQPNTRYWIVVRNTLGELDWATRSASAAGIPDEEATSTNNGISWSDSNVPNRYFMLRVEGCLVPRATVLAAQTTEPGSGTKQLEFTVSLSGPPGQDVTVLATTADGTAQGGADYVALVNEPFLFAAGGSTTRTVSVTINEDNLVEDNESFTLSLSAADAQRLIFDQNVATGTIVDTDAALFDDFNDNTDDGWYRYDRFQPTPAFSLVDGTYRLQTSPSPQISLGPANVAALRQDHTDSDFKLGVQVSSWDDSLDLGFGLIARSGGFGFKAPSGYAFLYMPDVAEARIIRIDDGRSDNGDILASGSVSLNAGGQYWFEFTGEGDAMEGKIFSSDDLATPVVTVAASDNRYSNTIVGIYASSRPPFGTTAVDVTFDNFLASTATAPLLSVRAVDADQAEGDSGTATHSFELVRGGTLDTPVTVEWAVMPVAADADDFGGTLPSGAVVFGSGETVKSVSFTTAGDGIVEPDEAYDLTIVSATGRAVLLESSARGAILNDDSATLEIGFGSSALQVREGQEGFRSAVTGLTLGEPVDTDIAVTVSTGDFTATVADNDYQPEVGATFIIPAGQTFLPVSLIVNSDTRSEAAFEVFQVRIDQVDAAGRDVSVIQSVTSVSIQDDDVTLSISGGPAEAVEGGGQGAVFTYTVSTSALQTSDLDLSWSVSGVGDNPTSPTDFLAASGTITILAGQSSADLTLTAVGDYAFEARESFEVTVSGPGVAASQTIGGAEPVASGTVAKQGSGAVLGASGGLDGAGRILTPGAAAAPDGSAVALVTIGAGADPAALLRQFQNGAALENYDSLVASGQLVEQARFAVDSALGHAGAFNGTAMVTPAANWTRVFLFAFNAANPGAATAGGVFGNLADWLAPTVTDQAVSFDGRLASEAYWGQLKISALGNATVDLEMAGLPGAAGGSDIGSVTIGGAIVNDDELASITPPDAGNVINLNHAGRPNAVYDLQISDDLINWLTLDSVTTDASGAAVWQETRVGKLTHRFYRFRISDN